MALSETKSNRVFRSFKSDLATVCLASPGLGLVIVRHPATVTSCLRAASFSTAPSASFFLLTTTSSPPWLTGMSTADTKDKSGLVATLQCYVDNSKLVGFIMWVIVVAIFQAVARDACATFVLAMEWTNLLLTIFHLISIGLALRVRKACRILWLEAR